LRDDKSFGIYLAGQLNFRARPGQPGAGLVVGTVIATAATSRRPKTRYLTGFGARPLLLARRILPDRGVYRRAS